MLFLIQYDRKAGQIVRFQQFAADRGAEAARVRLDLEIELLRRGVMHEVVVLDAADEEALRKTHRRYFEDIPSLIAHAIATAS